MCFVKTNELVELLVSKGLDINSKNSEGQTPLYFACVEKNNELVKILIKNKADVNIQTNNGHAPLHFTSNIEIVKLLIENGANPNIKDNIDNIPIFTKGGNQTHISYCEKFKCLLEYITDFNIKNSKGETIKDCVNSEVGSTKLKEIYEEYITRKTVKNLNKKQYDLVKHFLDILELKHE